MKPMLALALFLVAATAQAMPEKMTPEDAARLDAAVAHEALVMQAAQAQAAPYEKTIQALCEKYRIERAELGKSVGVHVETGAISRKSPTPAAKAPAPPPAPKAKGSSK